jgi:LuxR family maltose regulon positive regulatory protein
MPAAPLIATKLNLPPVQTDVIPRPQLFQLLEHGLKVPLILVSAPPGFGKSMLVASWIYARPAGLNTVWLSLDEGDNGSHFFWRYFIAALQKFQAGSGETAQTMLSSPNAPEMPTILTTLINELAALEGEFLLVLDDYHLIQSPPIHEHLKFFLDHLPANTHLALLTREDPPLGLARRRARQQMVEIRGVDLRFDRDEAAAFLNNIRKLMLTREQIAVLEQRTEGWITGLQMAALSLQGRDPAQFFKSFTRDNRYVADYLIEEVLQRQPESIRAFLLKTSILERLSASLCSDVTGEPNARDFLDSLERANLFLFPLDDHREWYRYHHLFAELLRQRLHETIAEETIAGLHRLACAWHEAQQDIPTAVRHARRIPDEGYARQVLQRHVLTFFQLGAVPQLFELSNSIPISEREALPALCAGVAWAALASNHFEAVDEWLKPIERHFSLPADAALSNAGLKSAERAALLEVLVIRLQLPAYSPTSERVAAIRDQLELLPPEQPCLFNVVANLKPVIAFNLGRLAENSGQTSLAASAFRDAIELARERSNRYLFHLARAHLAGIQAALGQLHAVRQTCEQGLTEDPVLKTSPFLALMHAQMGMLCYEWNDLQAAEQHFTDGLALARLWNHSESLVPLTLGLAHIESRAGDCEAALHHLEELGTPPVDQVVLPLEAYTAWLRFLNGDSNGAGVWLAAKLASAALEPNPVNEVALLDVARLMTALGRLEEAAALLEKICDAARAGGRINTVVRAKVILVKVLAGQGRTNAAISCLLEVLPLAAPEGYLSTFLDEGETLRQLLHKAKGKVSAPELRIYVEQVLAAFPHRESLPLQREVGSGSPELSDREREILLLVAAGLSNQAIAERLVISITTVKTHVGNIFHKLGVSSRIQAIARAEGLGLLPRR